MVEMKYFPNMETAIFTKHFYCCSFSRYINILIQPKLPKSFDKNLPKSFDKNLYMKI
ncbi:hypothetical protein RchiOBHm_Chr2g0159181 [Rosa chinensis]|uniref:Uncharacterized protein n=1 Tax=Rosa chinensis TaxID=74649 RepID=A0A2P6S272_ROSCH|nr:hypothetical protein RchiOBHm_Chr2g0159181 [Rosa chinensis]